MQWQPTEKNNPSNLLGAIQQYLRYFWWFSIAEGKLLTAE